jgi:hypothetical protein
MDYFLHADFASILVGFGIFRCWRAQGCLQNMELLMMPAQKIINFQKNMDFVVDYWHLI